MAMVPLEMEQGSDFGHKHAYLLRKTGSANLEQTKRSWLGYVMHRYFKDWLEKYLLIIFYFVF